MLRNGSPLLLIGLGLAVFVVYFSSPPDGHAAHQRILAEQFHLPDDAEFELFYSPYRNRRTLSVQGIVQFTPAEYRTYVESLGDRSVWREFAPYAMKGVEVTAQPTPAAVTWRPGQGAILNDHGVSGWVEWGTYQKRGRGGKPAVQDVEADHSFCYVVIGEGSSQRVEACREYRHNPRGLRLTVRGQLDRRDYRLFLYVR